MSQYRDYTFIKIFHCYGVRHVQGMLIFGSDLRGLHGDDLAEGLHDALVLEEEDGVGVLLQTGERETSVVVLQRGLA